MASNSKQYGLIFPQKANQGLVRDRLSIFNNSSESEDESGTSTDWVKKALKRESERTFQKKQHQLDIQKALAEDPTVYQYDEVYDKIEEKKAELSHVKKQQERKPRYIQSLLQQAEKRKLENERRNERIIQKERETEGDKFKDKESFVTSAYRQKLEEFKKLEEEERRQDAIEALTDVSKQKDLSGFYRHLYRQTVSGVQDKEVIKQESVDMQQPSEKLNEDSEPQGNSFINPDGTKENSSNRQEQKGVLLPVNCENPTEKKSSGRSYRKRKSSLNSCSGSDDATKYQSANLDADSDFSVDSDTSESIRGSDSEKGTEQNKRKKMESNISQTSAVKNNKNNLKECGVSNREKQNLDDTKKEVATKIIDVGITVKADPKEETSEKELKTVSASKVNIWEKRTVGDVFESAVQRYYQRKAAKLSHG